MKLAIWILVFFLSVPCPAQELGIWITVGGGTTDNETRRLGWGLPDSGWCLSNTMQKYIIDSVKKTRDAGFRPIVILHNPWGTQSGEVMDFDQFIEARENPKLEKLKDFRPFLRHFMKPLLAEDGELIIYLGSISHDPDMMALEAFSTKYINRASASVSQIPAGVSIGYDMAGGLMPGSPGFHFVKLKEALGTKSYIEPRPRKGAATIGMPVICDGPWWNRSDPEQYADAAELYARNDECGDEIIRFVFSSHGDQEARKEIFENIRNAGHTIATTPTLIDEALSILEGE